jgi:tetratricopeptide (TPR) repeat protein
MRNLKKNVQNAVNSFVQAADIGSTFSDAFYNKGISLLKLGKYNLAIRAFDAALKQHPHDRRTRAAWKQAQEALLAKSGTESPALDTQTKHIREK